VEKIGQQEDNGADNKPYPFHRERPLQGYRKAGTSKAPFIGLLEQADK